MLSFPRGYVLLKALCHAIRVDCLYISLIEAVHAYTISEQWAWWMADKFVCSFKSIHSVGHLTFQALCNLS